MRSIGRWSLGLAAVATVLGGCASLAAAEGSKTTRVCINRREINSIRPLDDQHVFVKLSASHFYLLTVDSRCGGLRSARTIAISDGTTRVCNDGLTLLSFAYPSMAPVRCRIEGIDSVPNMNAARELIESRAAPE